MTTSGSMPAGDEPRPARRAGPKKQAVQLGCGHWVDVDHQHGDRRITCPQDESKWVVAAQDYIMVTYEVRQAPPE